LTIPQDKATVFKKYLQANFSRMRWLKGEKQDGRHGNTPKRFLVQN
jgi:hypothetical protein